MSPPRSTDTAALALEYGNRLVLGSVRDVHRAVARRAFGPTRRVGGAVPQAIHDLVSEAVYDTLSTGTRRAGDLARYLAGHGLGRLVDDGRAGRQVRSAVNGLVGADLHERADPYSIAMTVRHRGRDLPLDAETLAHTFAGAGGHLVVFVHGLGENDDSWGRRADVHGGTYASRLATETAATPLVLRYNTGRHVSDNGAELASVLERLVEGWPVEVTGLTLVGHSMGGLVVRAATNRAVADAAGWAELVRHVVCLGTPHLGAALEKAVHIGGRALALFPESAPFHQILAERSPGIVDLRHGYINRQEWEGQDLSTRWGLDRRAAPALPGADYHFVAATLGRSRTGPSGTLLGDWLVGFGSATGRGRRGEPVVPHATAEHLPGADHFALLNHPRVADWLVDWVGAIAAKA